MKSEVLFMSALTLVVWLGVCLNEVAASEARETLMFREALRDETMRYLARENFSDVRLAAGCAVLSLQWREGRIAESSPSNPGDPGVPLLMHGMAEVTLFALSEYPQDEVDKFVKRALEQFEVSRDFREAVMSGCSELMIAPLRFVMQKYNMIE